MLRGALALLLLIASATVTLAAETILLYRSDVQVQANGDFLVTETIRVNAEGRNIRRGIYRDFPLRFEDAEGRTVLAGFELLSATRDGRPEPSRVERNGSVARVYLGEEDVFLSPGVYTYDLTYRTDRQVRFFADHDEVYWNATGTEWIFPIEKAIAVIDLPDGTTAQDTAAYTGSLGSRSNYARTMLSEGDNVVTFETTRPLEAREGLTVVVELDKDAIDESALQQFNIEKLQPENEFSIIDAARLIASLAFWFLP